MRCSQEPETRIFGLSCALVALIEMSQTAEISMKLTYPPFVRASRYSPSVARIAGSQRMILLLLAMGCILSAGVWAQESSETVVIDKQTLQLMVQRIDQLEARVNQLEAERSSFSSIASATGITQASLALPSASSHVVADTPADPEAFPQDPERMDLGRTLLHIRGFGDFGLFGANQKGQSTAFSMGELNLFVTSNLSERLKFLSEIVFQNYGPYSYQANDFTVDVERALLEYSYNDYLNLSIGRFHTAVGYYNTAYHRSAWMQTALERPFLFSFEDEGGILPLHEIGVSASGQIPSGKLGLHYVVEVGNGRGARNAINSLVETPVDIDNHKAENIAVFIRPESLPGLQVGMSNYRELLSPTTTERIRETIWDAYAMLSRGSLEWLNEGLVVRHTVVGASHVYETPGFYSQLSKRFGSYTPYFLYQYVNAPIAEPIFSDVGLRTGPSAGIRFDATESVAFKLQYDYTTLRKQQPINSVGLQVGFTF